MATAWGDDALLIFGGTGASFKCFAGVHALDIRTGRWERLRPEGPAPGPRAGHAAATVDDRFWCVVGGGNNENAGAADVAALDLDAMEWIDCAKTTTRGEVAAFAAPLVVGEGMSLDAVASEDGERALVAFGGYNGACRRDVQTYRFARVFPDGDGEDDADAQDGDDVRARNGARTLERGTDDATATAEEDARDDSARDGRSTTDRSRRITCVCVERTRGFARRRWRRREGRRRRARGWSTWRRGARTSRGSFANAGSDWIAWTRRWRRCRGNSTESRRASANTRRFARRFGVCRTRGSYLEEEDGEGDENSAPGREVGSDCDGTRPRRS